jgi:hypothetical protein
MKSTEKTQNMQNKSRKNGADASVGKVVVNVRV